MQRLWIRGLDSTGQVGVIADNGLHCFFYDVWRSQQGAALDEQSAIRSSNSRSNQSAAEDEQRSPGAKFLPIRGIT